MTAWHSFSDQRSFVDSIASRTSSLLEAAVQDGRRAVLGVSGGTTPELYLPALAQHFSNWNAVTVFPVDERIVPPGSVLSNAGGARRLLPGATVTSLVAYELAPDLLLASAAAVLNALPEVWDLALLGMGTDGHIASLFPGSDGLEGGTAACVYVEGAPIARRLSLTLSALMRFKRRFLIVTGADKAKLLARAAQGDVAPFDLPVAALFAAPDSLEIFQLRDAAS